MNAQPSPRRLPGLSYDTGGLAGLLALFLLFVAGCGPSGPGVEVVELTPGEEVPRTTNLTFVFSDDVVPDSLVSRPLEGRAVEFEPPLPGQFQWVDRNKLRFYPEVMLAPSTEYEAEVQNRAVAPYGRSLTGERTVRFQTPRLTVNSAFLTFEYDPTSNRTATLVGSIEFNYEVSPQAVQNHVTIRYDDGEVIPYEVTTTGPSPVIELRATGVERGEDERQIEVQVDDGIQALGGALGLADAYTRPVMLPGQNSLKVEQVAGVRTSAERQTLKVRFNLPVRAEDAASYVTIEPQVDAVPTSSHNTLRLHGDFQPEQTYQVTVREGLMAVDGSQLGRDFKTAVSFRDEDLPPQLDFVGDGFYLTRSGHLNLGLATINLEKVSLQVDKIYANNLVYALNAYNFGDPDSYYYWNTGLEALGTQIYQEDRAVPVQPNEEVVTPVALQQYLREHDRGIFKVTARETERRWRSAARWVIATDLGMVAKEAGDDLWVWVTSLASLQPVQGAALTLYSQNNQELASAQTDESGIAILRNVARFDDAFTPYVVTAELGDDLSFLELTRRQLSTSDFDVGGLPYLQNGYEAFLYDERGVYRPGETAHVAAIVRGPNAEVPQPFPVRLRVTGPDGSLLTEQRARLNEEGGTAFEVDVPDYALTGRYSAVLQVGEDELGRTTFSVEEFIPDRMKVRVDLDQPRYTPGDAMQIAVEGLTLFGPPAAGRTVQASVSIEKYPFQPDAYRSFTFGDTTRSFTPVQAGLDEQRLDDDGRARMNYTIPREMEPPSSLRAVVEATVLEPGGRGVTEYAGAVVHPYDSYVGVRQRQEGYAEPGQPLQLDMVVLSPEGEPVAGRSVRATLYSVFWNSIWRRGEDGQYRYQSERTEVVESTQMLASADGVQAFSITPEEYGQYRLVLEDLDSGARTVHAFYSSGWGYAAWAMDTPDRVQLELDKEQYDPGETATVLVRAPFPGKLLLTVEREAVLDRQVVTMEENTATVEVPVEAAYKPNVYLSAHLVRSTDGLERDESVRAFGVVPLRVNSDANRLNVTLDAPETMQPRQPLTIDVQVENSQGPAYVTVAAVDEGITQLTDFQAPDPHSYFFGKKRLSVDTYDLYGVILPEVASSLLSPAGDVEAARRRRVSPVAARRVKPVAFWSGPVETDRRGRTQVTFDIPQFNGTVRLMAVAYAGDRFGQGLAETIVRDPIVMTPTLPRFIGSGDRFQVPVSLYNGTGSSGTFTVRLEHDGPVTVDGPAQQQVQVAADREAQVYFTVEADRAMGAATFRLIAEGQGQRTRDEIEVPVRPPVPYTAEAGSGSVQSGGTAQFTLPGAFLPDTRRVSLTTSALPNMRFTGSLKYLLRYPHGCLEQTTSRLFPLLAYYDLAREADPEQFEANGADYFIEEGIAKLERMQLPSGAFAYWPGGQYSNTWSTVYAAHFLVEARRDGYVVTEHVHDRMLDAVGEIARGHRSSERRTLEQSAYATYVLALAGAPDRSTMNYLRTMASSQMPTYARYLLGGAYGLIGDDATARDLLPQAAMPPVTIAERETGENFNSPVRSQAIMLNILADLDPASPQVPRLVQALTQAADRGRWATTQENAFAFLALGKLAATQETADFTGEVLVDGTPVATFDETTQQIDGQAAWAGQTVTLRTEGSGTAYYYWRVEGLPSGLDVDEYDRDLLVRRRYLSERGSPITDLSTFEQGDLVIVELTMTSPETLDNVAVADLLPAGFEIENPRLQSRKGIDWIADDVYSPDYVDIRDDRLFLYGRLDGGTRHRFYYGVRAVTAGTFRLPPVRAEAMYAPEKASVASSGRVVVQPVGADELFGSR
ncbi:MAG: hypothetical protein GVY18_02410 [Bacteroidetes bacterium]|jgi:uncharacterized protein YfaS (alpha-2-macroglobulin family)|nr:hypothetical protein [Bacteroidota bacterium]